MQVRTDKIRPIVVGTAVRRLVTKILLPDAISDSRDCLAPQKLANSVLLGLDIAVHETQGYIRTNVTDPSCLLLKLDALKAFNEFSRQVLGPLRLLALST